MAKAKLYSKDGTFKSEIDLPEGIFDQPISEPAMHFAVNVYLSNNRQGTSKTKSRSEVSGGGKKPWKQKGTGRARSGSNTSPVWVRGGKAHGPQPRDYTKKINKKIKKQAFNSALSLKAQNMEVHVFDSFDLSAAKTKELCTVLKTASLVNQKNLIVVSKADEKLLLAARNIPATSIEALSNLNTYEILNTKNLIFTEEAVSTLAKAGDE